MFMFLHDREFVCRTGWGGGVADLIPDPVTPNTFLTLVVMFSLQPFRRCQKKLTDRRFEVGGAEPSLRSLIQKRNAMHTTPSGRTQL